MGQRHHPGAEMERVRIEINGEVTEEEDVEVFVRDDKEERMREQLEREIELELKAEEIVETNDFTWRAVIIGVLVGGLTCFSNMYFGLQSGWISLGSLQSALIGFAVLKVVAASSLLQRPNLVSRALGMGPFGPKENVLLTSTAVATATMPLAGGFVGILPAIGLLTDEERGSVDKDQAWWALVLWSLALAFFGVFFAVPLRRQTILREKLKFPSGTATAHMIKVLHGQASDTLDSHKPQEFELLETDETVRGETMTASSRAPAVKLRRSAGAREDGASEDNLSPQQELEAEILDKHEGSVMEKAEWDRKWLVLYLTFAFSGGYVLIGYFIPVLLDMPVLSWVGFAVATEWGWSINPSLGYVGQGMIMGPRTAVSMLGGAVVGWAILGPIAQSAGWTSGPVNDWQTGARGWLLWISLCILLAESLMSLLVLVGSVAVRRFFNPAQRSEKEAEDIDPALPHQHVPQSWWISGLVVSSAICVAVLTPLYHLPIWQPLIAIVLALFVSVLAVRALGETDINPVSGVGKISQIVFALVAPKNIVSNLIAGAVAEAGALQAGDMMQDLKTGHLLKASPRAQFFGQLIGSFASIFFSVAAYLLYTHTYQVPGPKFPVPTAGVWVNMARMVNGEVEAHNVFPFCLVAGVLAGLLPVLSQAFPKWANYLPSGIGFAIGFYLTPNWTLPRVAGGLVNWLWLRRWPVARHNYMIIVASGFVLGEGTMSVVTALFMAAGIPPLF